MLTQEDLIQIERIFTKVLHNRGSKVFEDSQIYSLNDPKVQSAIGIYGVKHPAVSAIKKLEEAGIEVLKKQRIGSTVTGAGLNKYLELKAVKSYDKN